MQQTVQVRQASAQEDVLIAEHFYLMWLDNMVPVGAIDPDWQQIMTQFIDRSRQELQYQAYVAIVDDRIVGSASCQVFDGLYPRILKDSYRKDGYIWGVYVEPAYRRQGIATQLTQHTIAHLKSIGCTQAILNASPFGKPVYDSLGFVPGNVMRLDLVEGS